MNTNHIKAAAQAGAEAVIKACSHKRESSICCNPDFEAEYRLSEDNRETFAAAAISKFLELQSADVPSVEELVSIADASDSLTFHTDVQNVRTAIVTAYEARLAARDNADWLDDLVLTLAELLHCERKPSIILDAVRKIVPDPEREAFEAAWFAVENPKPSEVWDTESAKAVALQVWKAARANK